LYFSATVETESDVEDEAAHMYDVPLPGPSYGELDVDTESVGNADAGVQDEAVHIDMPFPDPNHVELDANADEDLWYAIYIVS
jgi:hypothetical protein